jgi:hypothetical protein
MKNHISLSILFLIFSAWLPSQAQTIGMRVPDSTVLPGNNIDYPVYADNTLTGSNILAFVLQLSFDQSKLQVVSVITTGTLTASFGSPALNTSVPGQVTIAGAGATPLAGTGKFIYIRFKALQPGGTGIYFTGTQNNYFNEGLPAMSFDNGSVNIPAPPVITVSPNSGLITKGETKQFTVSGGTAPYQWFLTNPSVATINATGLLTGTQAGFTKVVAVDNLGLRDTTSGMTEIRAMRLSIPTNLTQWQGADISIPVNTTDLTGLNILAGNFTISFSQTILEPIGIIQTGTLLASYPVPLFNTANPGTISFDFAGTTPLAGSGTLIYITFHVSAVNAGGSSLSFSDGIFNETLIPNFTNGSFSTINFPVLSITPASGTLIAGQTKQFTLNGGGTPPIVWSVSNPMVASINQTGLMTTVKGGNITVTATDAHGATAITGNWLVYDTQVTMPDTTTCPAAMEFYYPILIKALPAGESVYAVQATVTYNTTYLIFQNLETTGTLTQGWTYVSNPSAGQITFAGSGVTPFNTAGNVVLLRFGFTPAFIVGSTASVQLPAITLNEGVPNPVVDLNGSIKGVSTLLPVSASISASANPVYTGNSVTFTALPVNGGMTPTYQWQINTTFVPGATNAAYTYVPANNDLVRCVMTSSAYCITGNPAISNVLTLSVVTVPANTVVTGTVIEGQNKCYNATNTITIAGGVTTFTVLSGSSVTMIAGQKIKYLPGTTVQSGGYLHGYIAPAGPWCISPPSAPVLKETVELATGKSPALFKIFPNPTNGNFTVSFDPETTPEQVNVEIFGMQGKKIISATIQDERKHTFSLADQPTGLYFIRVTKGNQTWVGKIIRQ